MARTCVLPSRTISASIYACAAHSLSVPTRRARGASRNTRCLGIFARGARGAMLPRRFRILSTRAAYAEAVAVASDSGGKLPRPTVNALRGAFIGLVLADVASGTLTERPFSTSRALEAGLLAFNKCRLTAVALVASAGTSILVIAVLPYCAGGTAPQIARSSKGSTLTILTSRATRTRSASERSTET